MCIVFAVVGFGMNSWGHKIKNLIEIHTIHEQNFRNNIFIHI